MRGRKDLVGLGRLAAVMALAALLAAVVWGAHRSIPGQRDTGDEAYLVLRPETARLLSFGFEALLADWYWLQAVQVVGREDQDPARHGRLLGRMIDAVTTLNPWVGHPYRFAAVWLTDSEASVRTANRLLRRAIAHHPEDWRHYFYLGFNHFFYLGEDEPAADALEQASVLPDAPRYLPRLAARLRGRQAGLREAEAFLVAMIRSAEDERSRETWGEALVELRTERLARMLDAARRTYRQRHGRDIEAVEDLAHGPGAVLARLPEEPNGSRWILGEDGRIVSEHYGRRYEPHAHPVDEARRRRWAKQREEDEG